MQIYKDAIIKRHGSQILVSDDAGRFSRIVSNIAAAKKYVNSGYDPAWKEVVLSPGAAEYLATMMGTKRSIYRMPLGWAAMFLENVIEAKQDGHDWPLDREIWNAFATIWYLNPNMSFEEFQARLKPVYDKPCPNCNKAVLEDESRERPNGLGCPACGRGFN